MSHRRTPTQPTNWELGNELLHRVMDNQWAMSKEVEGRDPELAKLLLQQREALVEYYRSLTEERAIV